MNETDKTSEMDKTSETTNKIFDSFVEATFHELLALGGMEEAKQAIRAGNTALALEGIECLQRMLHNQLKSCPVRDVCASYCAALEEQYGAKSALSMYDICKNTIKSLTANGFIDDEGCVKAPAEASSGNASNGLH